MTSLLPAPDSKAGSQPPAGTSAPTQSLADRVAALPAATIETWLANAGVAAPDSARDAATAGRPAQSPASGGDLPWGFARDMPSLDELFAAAAGPAGRPARGGTSAGRGADPDAGQAQTSHVADDYGGGERFGEEAGGHHRSLYMRRLQDSRAFHCPDATECMAEALGAKEALQSLQGSLAVPQLTAQRGAAVSELRAVVKADMQAAWAREAVRRGVALAKQGDSDGARSFYDKARLRWFVIALHRALTLDPRCCDAYVARGAALANAQRLPEAVEDLQRARDIDPGDVNAAKYLDAVRQRMARQTSAAGAAASLGDAWRPRAEGPPPSRGPAAPSNGQHAPPAVEPRQQPVAGGVKRGRDDSASETDSSATDEDGEVADGDDGDMDVETALNLVSKHYTRNVSREREGKRKPSKRERLEGFGKKRKRKKEKRSKRKKVKR